MFTNSDTFIPDSDFGPDTVINQNQQPFQSPLQSENLMPFDSEEEYEFKDTTDSTVGYRRTSERLGSKDSW